VAVMMMGHVQVRALFHKLVAVAQPAAACVTLLLLAPALPQLTCPPGVCLLLPPLQVAC
jgi:hypothetical protein